MDLKSMKIDEIKAIAKELGIKNLSKYKKTELIEIIEKTKAEYEKKADVSDASPIEKTEIKEEKNEQKTGLHIQGDDNLVSGVLEVMPDGFGFLRGENYLSTPKDIYVSPTQIRRFNLKTGDKITGIGRNPKDGEKFPALIFVQHVNDDTPDKAIRRKPFEYLTPIFPDERLKMETCQTDHAMRLLDLIAPVGKGQRGIIVAPPKAGKTTLLKNIANSIEKNYPEAILIVLLIDERPEEVTDMKRSIKGDVVYSTFVFPSRLSTDEFRVFRSVSFDEDYLCSERSP